MVDRDDLIDLAISAIEDDDYIGVCIECGETQSGCEPDARKYECESCGCHSVYGAEEIIIMYG